MEYLVISFDIYNSAEVRLHLMTSSLDEAVRVYTSVSRSLPVNDAPPIVDLVEVDRSISFSYEKGVLLFWGDTSRNPVDKNAKVRTLRTTNVAI